MLGLIGSNAYGVYTTYELDNTSFVVFPLVWNNIPHESLHNFSLSHYVLSCVDVGSKCVSHNLGYFYIWNINLSEFGYVQRLNVYVLLRSQ